MPPFGATGKNRAAPTDLGGNGSGLGEARQRDRSECLSLVALIGLRLGVVLLGQAQPSPVPSATTRRAPSRPGRCLPCPSTPWRSDDNRQIAPCGKRPLRPSG